MIDNNDSDWIEDKRDEFRQMYAGYFRMAMATEKQIDCIKDLCLDAWLFKDDFPTSRKFYRKKTLTSKEADQLIRRAMAKQNEPAHLRECEDGFVAALQRKYR
jgi:hypothetical protein